MNDRTEFLRGFYALGKSFYAVVMAEVDYLADKMLLLGIFIYVAEK